jgi:hypothetical protein
MIDMQAFISSRELSTGQANSRNVNFNCMFCSAEVLSDAAYMEHLDTAHHGWADLIVARLALNIPRVNG